MVLYNLNFDVVRKISYFLVVFDVFFLEFKIKLIEIKVLEF